VKRPRASDCPSARDVRICDAQDDENPLSRKPWEWFHRHSQLDDKIVSQHQQLDDCSCIPMAVELVLKLLGRVPADFYGLQLEWHNRKDGSFDAFDGRTISGVQFRLQFRLPRDDRFPLDDLFLTIENELKAGRYVIVSLAMPGGGWHMFVIHERLPSGEFRAVSRVHGRTETLIIDQVREIVKGMNGTDILTYLKTRRAWPIVVGVVLFASLMGWLRYELSSVWARAVVAGCAFAVLGWAVRASRRQRS